MPVPPPRAEESLAPAEMPTVQEITTTLREWATIWKQLFVVRDEALGVGGDLGEGGGPPVTPWCCRRPGRRSATGR